MFNDACKETYHGIYEAFYKEEYRATLELFPKEQQWRNHKQRTDHSSFGIGYCRQLLDKELERQLQIHQ